MTEQATLNENVSETDLNLWNTANGWKNHNRRPWPETRIFIEMDSACRNQQGNCDEVENSARPFLLFFQHCGWIYAITAIKHCFTKTWKTMFDPYIECILWNIWHEFIWRRTHELASASPPYERVPNISQYTSNNLFIIHLSHLSSSFICTIYIRNQNIISVYQPKICFEFEITLCLCCVHTSAKPSPTARKWKWRSV